MFVESWAGREIHLSNINFDIIILGDIEPFLSIVRFTTDVDV